MRNRFIGVGIACLLSLGAADVFAQHTASGSGAMTTTHGGSGSGGQVMPGGTLTLSDPFHGQPPTGQPPTGQPPTAQPPTSPPQMAFPPRLQTPQPGRQTPKVATLPQRFEAHLDNPNGPQAFSVVLVVGEMEGTPGADNVPAAARKALTDLKDFLPYKNYRLLDSQWTLCCGRGAIFSRLRGLDEQEYELQLTPSVSGAANSQQPVVNVRFMLMEAGATRVESARQADQLLRELHAAQEQQRKLQGGVPSATPEQVRLLEQQVAATSRRSHASRQVIDASFRMDVGETVVVGTSRIQGDKALIALLTAVPPKAGAGR